MWQVHVVQHPNVAFVVDAHTLLMKHGGKTMPVTIEAPTMVPWRSSCSARHSVGSDMSSELRRRSTLRVCRGVSVTDVSISANTSVVRRRFSGRDSSGAPRRRCLSFVLISPATSLAASHAIRVVCGPPRATGAAKQRAALPNQHHIIIVMTSSRARDAPRRVHLTTTQQGPE